MFQYKFLFFILLLIFISSSSISFAQTTGKIAGIVTDKDSGDPLPGANIVIDGTYKGAAADKNGNFFIINLPPGVYNIKASMIGYSTLTIQKVRVNVNSTSNIRFVHKTETI